jgi:hypothetical protein
MPTGSSQNSPAGQGLVTSQLCVGGVGVNVGVGVGVRVAVVVAVRSPAPLGPLLHPASRTTHAPATIARRRPTRGLSERGAAFVRAGHASGGAAGRAGTRSRPFIGGAAVLAFILHRWWVVPRRLSGLRARLVGATCVGLALVHLGLAPVQRLALPVLLPRALHEHLAAAMNNASFDDPLLATRSVVILAAPDIAIGLHAYAYRRLYRMPMPEHWSVLSWSPCPHRFQRTDDHTLEMELMDASWRRAASWLATWCG